MNIFILTMIAVTSNLLGQKEINTGVAAFTTEKACTKARDEFELENKDKFTLVKGKCTAAEINK